MILPIPFSSALGSASKSEYTFMLKSMDWHKFFHYNPADWTIESTLDRLDRSIRSKWPLNDAEELRVQRPHELLSMMDVQYRAQATRDFSCTLGLEIAPWAMFINDTNLDVSICLVAAGVRHKIRASCLEMLPVLSSHFTLDAPFGSNWVSSMAICVEQQGQASSVPSGSKRHVLLRANSYVDIVLVRNNEVMRLLLDFKLDDGRRIFKLRSKYVIANFTNLTLTALPLTMDHKETCGRGEVNSLQFDTMSRRLKPVQERQDS